MQYVNRTLQTSIAEQEKKRISTHSYKLTEDAIVFNYWRKKVFFPI